MLACLCNNIWQSLANGQKKKSKKKKAPKVHKCEWSMLCACVWQTVRVLMGGFACSISSETVFWVAVGGDCRRNEVVLQVQPRVVSLCGCFGGVVWFDLTWGCFRGHSANLSAMCSKNSINKMSLLRSLCRKTGKWISCEGQWGVVYGEGQEQEDVFVCVCQGVQVLARNYVFSASPVFCVEDVVGIFPVVSHTDVRVGVPSLNTPIGDLYQIWFPSSQ